MSDSPASSDSVADTLARALQTGIARGEFALGSSLPSERELMSTYQVSRATVREALRVLSAQGLIAVKRGRSGGSFITSPGTNAVVRSLNLFIKGQHIRFIDLLFARDAIEPAAAAQAAIAHDAAKIEQLRLCCVECENTVHDLEKFVEANLRWHLTVAEASTNPLFITFLTSIAEAMHIATNFEEFDLRTRKAVVGVHWQIFEAIRTGDPEAARRRMGRHLSAYGERLSPLDLALADSADL